MNEVSFSRAYNNVVEQVLQYTNNYRSMSPAQRAEGAIENLRDTNKVFTDRARDNMLGQRVDILV